MSNVIDLLERIGMDSQLRLASGADLEQVLTAAGLDPTALRAILETDQRRLEALLGARANVCCMVQTPDREDDEEEEEESEDDEPEEQVRFARQETGRAATLRQ